MPVNTENTRASERRFAVLAPEPAVEKAIPRSGCFMTFREATEDLLDGWRNIFVLVSLAGLPRVSEFIKKANRRHRLCALFVRRDHHFDLLPQFLHHSHVRTLRNMLVHEGPTVPWRVLNAYRLGAEHHLIADAQVVKDWLFVVSCAWETFEISFEGIPALRGIPAPRRREFTVSQDGAYVHWPVGDVHLDLDSIRRRTDPDWAQKKRVEELQANATAGGAIAAVRRLAKLRQADIPGLSERQVRRIEGGEGTTLSALKRLAAAHGADLNTYIERVAEAARS